MAASEAAVTAVMERMGCECLAAYVVCLRCLARGGGQDKP